MGNAKGTSPRMISTSLQPHAAEGMRDREREAPNPIDEEAMPIVMGMASINLEVNCQREHGNFT